MSPQWHPKTCRICGRHEDEVGSISGTGLCLDHAVERMWANNTQLVEHRGPWFDHWRRRSLAALGVTLVDGATETR